MLGPILELDIIDLYEFIPGKTPDYNDFNQIKQIAQGLAQIHSLNFQILTDENVPILHSIKVLKNAVTKLEQNYPQLVNPTLLSAFNLALTEYTSDVEQHRNLIQKGFSGDLHGDVINNFICDSSGKIWFIDWEKSEHGDILEEICSFLSYNDINEQSQIAFLQEYQSTFSPTQEIDILQLVNLEKRRR